jgi:hypothetical protein
LKTDFPKIPKENNSGKEKHIIKCSRILTFDHLLAVNPCGQQAKK